MECDELGQMQRVGICRHTRIHVKASSSWLHWLEHPLSYCTFRVFRSCFTIDSPRPPTQISPVSTTAKRLVQLVDDRKVLPSCLFTSDVARTIKAGVRGSGGTSGRRRAGGHAAACAGAECRGGS